MNNKSIWLFNESKSVGVNYFDKKLVREYDKEHEKFRNFEEEALKISDAVDLSKDSIILDIGCGTGGLTTHFSRICKHVYAVDPSDEMIGALKNKIQKQNLTNVTPIQSGFLSYDYLGESLDAVVANICLHHLPDFWKQVALYLFHKFLKPDGKLFLSDVVFDFKPQEYQKTINSWIDGMRSTAGNQMAEEAIIHIREEFSTWDWIMTGMLDRAGFHIDRNTEIMPHIRAYVCTKK
ncbi:MAG: class I SAM-dependent methyltransferase [bacterium]